MRLQLLSIFATVFLLVNPARGISARDSAHPENFKTIAEKIEEQTGLVIAYCPDDIAVGDPAVPDISGMSAEEALRKVLDPDGYNFINIGKHIVIRKTPRREETDEVETKDAAVERLRLANFAPEKIPPRQSVFSGETRLIIIRERDVSGGGRLVTLAGENENDAAPQGKRPLRWKRIAMQNGITAMIPVDESVEEVDSPAGRTIPFRWDLYETQAYRSKAIQAKKPRSQRRKK